VSTVRKRREFARVTGEPHRLNLFQVWITKRPWGRQLKGDSAPRGRKKDPYRERPGLSGGQKKAGGGSLAFENRNTGDAMAAVEENTKEPWARAEGGRAYDGQRKTCLYWKSRQNSISRQTIRVLLLKDSFLRKTFLWEEEILYGKGKFHFTSRS